MLPARLERNVNEGRSLVVVSSIAFVLAGMVATTLHELAHFVMAAALGAHAELFPPYVSLDEATSQGHTAIIAATGPLFSLISGLVMIVTFRRMRDGFAMLFVLWLGFLSAQIGFGYLLISPFAQTGDTGFVLSRYADNWFAYLVAVAVGAAGSYLLLPRQFAKIVSSWVSSKPDFFKVGMYPWMVGTLILLAIYFLIEGIVLNEGDGLVFSLFATATIGIFTPIADYVEDSDTNPIGVSRPLLGASVATVMALLLIGGLSQGIEINR